MIMIHGTPLDDEYPEWYFSTLDWTNGCIAMNNTDMREVWSVVKDGTLIEIRPDRTRLIPLVSRQPHQERRREIFRRRFLYPSNPCIPYSGQVNRRDGWLTRARRTTGIDVVFKWY